MAARSRFPSSSGADETLRGGVWGVATLSSTADIGQFYSVSFTADTSGQLHVVVVFVSPSILKTNGFAL